MMEFEFEIIGNVLFSALFALAFLFAQFILPLLFASAFCLSLRIYLYIGITSLCLYNTSKKRTFQDAILNKVNKLFLCKIQKFTVNIHLLSVPY